MPDQGLQEEVFGWEFGRRQSPMEVRGGQKTLGIQLNILNYSVESRDLCNPYLFNKLNYDPWAPLLFIKFSLGKFLSSLLNPFLLFAQIEIHVLLPHAGVTSTPSLSCALLPSSHASAFFLPSIWAAYPEIQYR